MREITFVEIKDRHYAPQESGVRSQESGVRSQESGFRIQKSGEKLLFLILVPCITYKAHYISNIEQVGKLRYLVFKVVGFNFHLRSAFPVES